MTSEEIKNIIEDIPEGTGPCGRIKNDFMCQGCKFYKNQICTFNIWTDSFFGSRKENE